MILPSAARGRIHSKITAGFWRDRLTIHSEKALFHQYEQLERTGCLTNFAIAAGTREGFREGFFFADSDAFKWLEAACLSLADTPNPELARLVNGLIELCESAQQADGYLYTYNQIHFPNSRWQNLQVEHELYCMGHWIEAGVSHYQTTGSDRLLKLACKTADLIVDTFMDAENDQTDGHEEIEIALLRLYQVIGNESYKEMARRFIARRGRVPWYGWKMAAQLTRTVFRIRKVSKAREQYYRAHPDQQRIKLPARNAYHLPRWIGARLVGSLLSGRFTQNEKPVSDQQEPVGHAVRFVYLQTARAMLAGLENDQVSIQEQIALWKKMVERRMYVSGGIGALPLIEGFGNDYELPDLGAYAETCAAIGSIYWNQALGDLTGEACFADLLEWQLYNAAGVGDGMDGCSYLYNNPLSNLGEIQRQSWYDCPCCPSNLSRTLFKLNDTLWSVGDGFIRLNQYISSQTEIQLDQPIRVEVESGLPWVGENQIRFQLEYPQDLRLEFRYPSWADGCVVEVNGLKVTDITREETLSYATACGLDPQLASWVQIQRTWQDGDEVDIHFRMNVRIYPQDERIPGCGGLQAMGYGPLLYCHESLIPEPLILYPELVSGEIQLDILPDGINRLHARTIAGSTISFIPYFQWGNRGPTAMSVFFKHQTTTGK